MQITAAASAAIARAEPHQDANPPRVMSGPYPRSTGKAPVLRSFDGFDDRARVRAPMLLGVGRHVAQVPLRVERALRAAPGRGDGLAVGVIDEVADREDARQLGLGGGLIDDDVALAV